METRLYCNKCKNKTYSKEFIEKKKCFFCNSLDVVISEETINLYNLRLTDQKKNVYLNLDFESTDVKEFGYYQKEIQKVLDSNLFDDRIDVKFKSSDNNESNWLSLTRTEVEIIQKILVRR